MCPLQFADTYEMQHLYTVQTHSFPTKAEAALSLPMSAALQVGHLGKRCLLLLLLFSWVGFFPTEKLLKASQSSRGQEARVPRPPLVVTASLCLSSFGGGQD